MTNKINSSPDLEKAVGIAKEVLEAVKIAKARKKELPVEVICIVDRSGSMATIHNDVIGGINSFINEQKKLDGKANLTLVEFDHEYNVLQFSQDLQNAREITSADFKPRGSTALNDAIGKTVTDFISLREKNKVKRAIFCIMTDGGENASKEFKEKAALKALTERVQKDYGWEFVFLAANQDAFAEGSQYGFVNNVNFTATSKGVENMTRSYSASVSSYRNK